MKTKHTQGPWFAFEHHDGTWFVATSDDPAEEGIVIASGMTEDNARLIAAAPMMLKALQTAITMLRKPQDVLVAWGAHTATELESVVADATGVDVWDLPSRASDRTSNR